jgi:hypothetical protein
MANEYKISSAATGRGARFPRADGIAFVLRREPAQLRYVGERNVLTDGVAQVIAQAVYEVVRVFVMCVPFHKV